MHENDRPSYLDRPIRKKIGADLVETQHLRTVLTVGNYLVSCQARALQL